MNFKAAVLTKIKKPLQVINNLKLPRLKHGQVLVKVLHSAICRSQIMEIEGKRGRDKYIPHLLGHEGSGIVEKIGKGVSKVLPGDKVFLSWIKGKGLETGGIKIKNDHSIINAGPITTFSNYSIVSYRLVFNVLDC